MPVVRETVITPMERALLEMMAMAASPFTRLLLRRRSRNTAAATTTGTATASGASPSADATASAPKPTWESPSPIMEKRLSTSDTPSSAAHSDTSTPTMSARCMK